MAKKDKNDKNNKPKKRLLYFQVCVAVEALPTADRTMIENAVTLDEVRLSFGPSIINHGDPEVSFVESMKDHG